jgi:D-3-phosphoglycerate dehydrogenase
MNEKYLVVNLIPRKELDIERAVLKKIGCRIVQGSGSTEQELIETAGGAHALIGSGQPLTRKVFENLQNLRAVALIGVGHDTVDLEAAEDHHIRVTNVPDIIADTVADHTLALVLAITRWIPQGDAIVRRGHWENQMWKWAGYVPKLGALTAGIVGYGNTGQAVARRLYAFGMKILVFDPYAKREVEQDVVYKDSLHDLLSEIDILTLHAFLSQETYHMIGERELRAMKETAFIVNTSRGVLIDETALHKALIENRIAGAALDVMETEPPPQESPLLKLKNVILTPHVAYFSRETLVEQRQRTAEEVSRALRGLPPLHSLTRG